MRGTIFAPLTANGGHDKAVGRWICDFLARIVHLCDERVINVIVKRFDDNGGICYRFGCDCVLLSRVVCQESAVMRIARHRAKDHSQVARATRASPHQIEGLTKIHDQIVDLPRVAAKQRLIFRTWRECLNR